MIHDRLFIEIFRGYFAVLSDLYFVPGQNTGTLVEEPRPIHCSHPIVCSLSFEGRVHAWFNNCMWAKPCILWACKLNNSYGLYICVSHRHTQTGSVPYLLACEKARKYCIVNGLRRVNRVQQRVLPILYFLHVLRLCLMLLITLPLYAWLVKTSPGLRLNT